MKESLCSLKTEERVNFLGKKWLTTNEAAIYLGSTAGSVRNRVYRGQLTPKKFYGRCLFNKDELDRLIEMSEWRSK